MAIAVIFQPKQMNFTQYNNVHNELEKVGEGTPRERLYHACYGPQSNVHIFDVWESRQSFENFGKILMPILKRLNIDAGAPQIFEVQNINENKPAIV